VVGLYFMLMPSKVEALKDKIMKKKLIVDKKSNNKADFCKESADLYNN
jgi:hypothetical protein